MTLVDLYILATRESMLLTASLADLVKHDQKWPGDLAMLQCGTATAAKFLRPIREVKHMWVRCECVILTTISVMSIISHTDNDNANVSRPWAVYWVWHALIGLVCCGHLTLTRTHSIRQGHYDPAAGDQPSWLKPVIFSFFMQSHQCC